MMGPPGGNTRGMGNAGAAGNTGGGERAAPAEPRTIWRLDENGKPAALRVRTGLSDVINTEIVIEGERELEGVQLILRERI